MKKRLVSLVLTLCMAVMLIPSTVLAEQTDWKGIYFDFLKDELITKYNPDDYWSRWSNVTLADLNLDGIPELIVYSGLSQGGYMLDIFQIIDGKVQLRYNTSRNIRTSDNFNKDYIDTDTVIMGFPPSVAEKYNISEDDFDIDFYGNKIKNTISLMKNKYTDELAYVNYNYAGDMSEREQNIRCFSKDKIIGIAKSILMSFSVEEYEEGDEYGERITRSECQIDGNAVSRADYDKAYNEFLDTWQDTGYKLAFLETSDNVTEQQIRDFLNYYIHEKQALGIEDNVQQYGYVDVLPLNYRTFSDSDEIDIKYTNQSDKTITNKRVVLACLTLTDKKTNNKTEVVAAYLDKEEEFQPYAEKIATTRIGIEKTADGIPYTMNNKKISSNYTLGTTLDNMIVRAVQFANDKEFDEFMADLEANNIADLSNDEYIENNAKWLKALKGDK